VDKTFKKIVIASILLHTFLWFSPYFSYLWIEDSTIEMLVSVGGYGAVLPYDEYSTFFIIYDVVIYVGFVLSSIGMLFFKRIARVIFTALIMISTAVSLASGMVVATEGVEFLASISCMLDGAILALAYLSPLSKKFVPD
jgi:hypothetical protein